MIKILLFNITKKNNRKNKIKMELLMKDSIVQEISTITLKSLDGQSFQLDIQSAQGSDYLNEQMNEHPNEREFDIPEVEGKILKKIVEYLNHYKNKTPKEIPRPLHDSKIEKILDKWDYDYIMSFALGDCVDLLNASASMKIQPLLKLMCAKIAAKMMEGDVEEARKLFGIECDMTEEEKELFDSYELYPDDIQNQK